MHTYYCPTLRSGLQDSDFKTQTSRPRLQDPDFKIQTSRYRLQNLDFKGTSMSCERFIPIKNAVLAEVKEKIHASGLIYYVIGYKLPGP